MDIPNKTVPEKLLALERSDVRVVRESYAKGYVLGKNLAFWLGWYGKKHLLKTAMASTHKGPGKDKTAYQIGMVVGYMDQARVNRMIHQDEALTIDDLALLGLP